MYAELADVLARGGRLSGAWTDTSTPSLSDLERFLDSRQAEIDAALGSQNVELPLTDDIARTALRSLHAAGALMLALAATFPNREGPAAAAELMAQVTAEWQRGIASIAQGEHATVTYLTATGANETLGGEFSPWGEMYLEEYDREEVF